MSTTIAAAPSADPLSADAAPLRWHHQHPVRVYWEDTDAGGIVFYGNYLKFMERARTEWFSAALGVGQEQLRRSGQGMFVVTDTQLRYLRPARLDDRLVVTVAVAEVGRASVSFAQTVRRGDTVLCEGRVRVGWVMPVAPLAPAAEPSAPADETEPFRPARMPAHILNALPAPIPA